MTTPSPAPSDRPFPPADTSDAADQPASDRTDQATSADQPAETAPEPPQNGDTPAGALTPSRPNSELFPVVGIGASAGGLEAFTQLLSALPIDTGMAFVLVQHLSPSQPSMLREILARTTAMPVHEAQEGLAVAPNQVYVIPPNTLMTIAQGKLHLTPREQGRKASKAVDTFFYALAEECGHQAIGIVLSGGDGDGSLGLEAIKAAGGITFAQSEDSAKVSSMPTTAIATGQVDFILPPAEIATELVNISRHPYLSTPVITDLTEVLPVDGGNALAHIFNLLRTACGVDFTHYKHTTLQRRVGRRMALYQFDHLADYVSYLQDNPTEVQALYQEILIHVTSFFRDAETFKVLRRDVFPALLRDRQPPARAGDRQTESPIRIWVAGCSTGQEAYSIAISLLEFLSHQPRPIPIQIFATDVSEAAIEKARLGLYLTSQVADISPDRLQRFFVPMAGGYQVNKTVRELCIFARQNLISDPPFSRLDLISCRNVLIYFGSTLQKKVLSMFHYGLKSTGFLMLGSAESIGELPHLFHILNLQHKIYAKQPAAALIPMDLGNPTYPVNPTSSTPVDETAQPKLSLSQLVDQVVLRQYAPVGVVVNAQLDIIQFRGQTGAYLEPLPGQATLNVLSMVKPELRLDLRTAIHQVKQSGYPVRKGGIELRAGSRTWLVQMDVVPLPASTISDDYFVILFRELSGLVELPSEANATTPLDLGRSIDSQEKAEILHLEQKLESTKVYLQSIIEEQQSTNQDLRAANEEILSSNEELQSTNEELQTAKEEIQATNEELSTINDELYRRNTETMRISNDFQNLLASINIPIVMLESDLRIRRFTPTAATLFNLIPTDINRPLSDIKHNLTITNLEVEILEVMNTLTLKTQEVQDQAGHWYDLRIRPYRTLDNRIDGAVLVLVEIDALKRSTEQLRDARDYAEAIVQTVREPLLVLNAQLQVVTANPSFYRTFQVTPGETEGIEIFALGNGQWRIPQLRSLLEELLPQNVQIEDFQVDHEFEHIGSKTMWLNARKMSLNNGDQLILLAIEASREPPLAT